MSDISYKQIRDFAGNDTHSPKIMILLPAGVHGRINLTSDWAAFRLCYTFSLNQFITQFKYFKDSATDSSQWSIDLSLRLHTSFHALGTSHQLSNHAGSFLGSVGASSHSTPNHCTLMYFSVPPASEGLLSAHEEGSEMCIGGLVHSWDSRTTLWSVGEGGDSPLITQQSEVLRRDLSQLFLIPYDWQPPQ